jgi:hypothetical protein
MGLQASTDLSSQGLGEAGPDNSGIGLITKGIKSLIDS